MRDPTQAPATAPASQSSETATAAVDAAAIQRGLWRWLAIVAGGGIACVALGHAEGAVLFAGAGAFALAQASDAAAGLAGYRRFVDEELPPGSLQGRLVRSVVGALVPLAGAAFYVTFGAWAWRGAAERPLVFATAWCAGAALLCVALASRTVADAVRRVLVPGASPRTGRLAGRIAVMLLLLPAPALQLMPGLMATFEQEGGALADAPGLVAQLLAELAIGFAAVGLFVRRGSRETFERLGLVAMRPRDWAVAAAGMLAAIALNGVTDRVEHGLFPALWDRDAAVTRLIAAHLPVATSLLLGVSAGLGEEITVRGALQPRAGLGVSALLFACAHVQYSWFGVMTVGLLGLLLGTIRARTNTTTAIVVHGLYDVYAALTAG